MGGIEKHINAGALALALKHAKVRRHASAGPPIPSHAPPTPRDRVRLVPEVYAAKVIARTRWRGGRRVEAPPLPKPPRCKPPADAEFYRVHGRLFARVVGHRLYKYHPTKGWRGEKWS